MKQAIILDKELQYAAAIKRHLQSEFPMYYWVTVQELKDLYKILKTKSTEPELLIYTPAHYPKWQPSWSGSCIRLRKDPLYEDLFSSSLFPGMTSDKQKPKQTGSVYRLDLKSILRAVSHMAGSHIDVKENQIQVGKLLCYYSTLNASDHKPFLEELFREGAARGSRIYYLPFIPAHLLTASGLPRGNHMLEGADLGSLLDRLKHEIISSRQLLPYMNPGNISGVLSLYPSPHSDVLTTADPLALSRLTSMVRSLVQPPLENSCGIAFCSGIPFQLVRAVALASDELRIIVSAAALKNPALVRELERLKAALPPAYKVREFCINAPPVAILDPSQEKVAEGSKSYVFSRDV